MSWNTNPREGAKNQVCQDIWYVHGTLQLCLGLFQYYKFLKETWKYACCCLMCFSELYWRFLMDGWFANMPKLCAVAGCYNTRGKNLLDSEGNPINYFLFPDSVKQKDRYDKFVDLCQLKQTLPLHFFQYFGLSIFITLKRIGYLSQSCPACVACVCKMLFFQLNALVCVNLFWFSLKKV